MTLTRDASMHADVHLPQIFVGFNIVLLSSTRTRNLIFDLSCFLILFDVQRTTATLTTGFGLLPGISGHLERPRASRFIAVHLSSSQDISGHLRASRAPPPRPVVPTWRRWARGLIL